MLTQTRRAAVFAALILPLSAAEVFARDRAGDRALKSLDRDRDGTLSLEEVKSAASALFDRLDRDKDGTLEIKELQGRLSREEFRRGNPDNDGTLDIKEFLAIVEQRFKAANPDGDGTVDRKELASPAGRALLRLIQ